MSAVLASASAQFQFQGASITLACSSPEDLRAALATFGISAVAANDAGTATGKAKPAVARAVTDPAGPRAAPTAAPSAQPAAGPAAQGEAGNGAAAAGQGAAASGASSSTPGASPEVSFEVLKKAFLALSTKADGRAKCEEVLKPFGAAKLSLLAPEQYAPVLDAINKAAE